MGVHPGDLNFVQLSMTTPKGSTITLVDDTATPHIIANGSWVNGSAQAMQEQSMPTVHNLQMSSNGSSQSIGPFTPPGTFHLYCVVHPGMNLTVIVQ
ncbi:MAG TPA: plastocyanin/azurin family copper-binding protein [Ktedonobacteraceae bacterium]